MASFFTGDKLSKQDAINSLTLKISEYFGGRSEVRAVSDDGGQLLEIQIEVSEPSANLSEQLPDFPVDEVVPIWNGWRVVLLKLAADNGIYYMSSLGKYCEHDSRN